MAHTREPERVSLNGAAGGKGQSFNSPKLVAVKRSSRFRREKTILG